jgi:hypothetical protein
MENIDEKTAALQSARDAIQLKSMELGLEWPQSVKLDKILFEVLGLRELGKPYTGLSQQELIQMRNDKAEAKSAKGATRNASANA